MVRYDNADSQHHSNSGRDHNRPILRWSLKNRSVVPLRSTEARSGIYTSHQIWTLQISLCGEIVPELWSPLPSQFHILRRPSRTFQDNDRPFVIFQRHHSMTDSFQSDSEPAPIIVLPV